MALFVAYVLAVALLLSVPVGLALGIAAMVGLLISSPEALILLPQKFLAGLDSFPLMAIPLFVLAGTLMAQGGMARRIVDMAMVLVGRIPGGLGLVVIISAMLFSGISGSPSANTAAIGSVAIPAMQRGRYPTDFATAILASAGGVSMLVPPAIDLIVIGVVTGMSIGALFAAGVLPAVIKQCVEETYLRLRFLDPFQSVRQCVRSSSAVDSLPRRHVPDAVGARVGCNHATAVVSKGQSAGSLK